MRTIREIIEKSINRPHLTGSIKEEIRESMEMNLYRKLWEAMLVLTTPTHKEIDGEFHAAICPPKSVVSRAEDLVVAWWNKKEGIVDDAD